MPAEVELVHIFEYLLVALGGLILLAALVHWRRQGGGDPLRGSPLRLNRLGLLHVWFCLCTYPAGMLVGQLLAIWLSPADMPDAQSIRQQSLMIAFSIPLSQAIICPVIGRLSFTGGWRGFGLGRRRLQEILAYALGGWLLSLCLTGVIFQVTNYLFQLFYEKLPEHAVFTTLQNSAIPQWMKIMAVLSALLLAPVGEELFFRGILQTALKKAIPPQSGSMRHRWLAILITAALFGLMHYNVPQHVPPLIVFGFILGFLYERSGSLYVPILVHILFNAKSLLWYKVQMEMMMQ